jgi:integrase
LHDLRRSFASGLGRLGVAPHVIEKALNHKLKGVMRIYQRHDYAAEIQEAFELWSRHIAKITAIIAP